MDITSFIHSFISSIDNRVHSENWRRKRLPLNFSKYIHSIFLTQSVHSCTSTQAQRLGKAHRPQHSTYRHRNHLIKTKEWHFSSGILLAPFSNSDNDPPLTSWWHHTHCQSIKNQLRSTLSFASSKYLTSSISFIVVSITGQNSKS